MRGRDGRRGGGREREERLKNEIIIIINKIGRERKKITQIEKKKKRASVITSNIDSFCYNNQNESFQTIVKTGTQSCLDYYCNKPGISKRTHFRSGAHATFHQQTQAKNKPDNKTAIPQHLQLVE